MVRVELILITFFTLCKVTSHESFEINNEKYNTNVFFKYRVVSVAYNTAEILK